MSKKRHIKPSVRLLVKNRFSGRCGYCGQESDKLCIDHIVPIISSKSTNEESNLMPACFQCNNFKMAFTIEEFRNELQRQVERARKYSVNFRLAEKFEQIKITESPIKFYFEKYEVKP